MTQAKNGVIIKSYWVVKMSLCAIVSGYCHCWLILCWFVLIINRVAVTGLLQSHNSGRGPSTVSQHRTWKLRDLYGVLRLHDLFKVKIMNLGVLWTTWNCVSCLMDMHRCILSLSGNLLFSSFSKLVMMESIRDTDLKRQHKKKNYENQNRSCISSFGLQMAFFVYGTFSSRSVPWVPLTQHSKTQLLSSFFFLEHSL